jgi:hypothetical protein
MATERAVLHTLDHRTAEASADVVRTHPVWLVSRSLLVILVGFAVGFLSILWPLNIVSVWLIPLMACGLAYALYTSRVRIREVSATCPLCGAAVRVGERPMDDPMWIRCPSCEGPLRLELTGP